MDIAALLTEARDNSPKAQFEAYNYYFERSQKSGLSAAEREKCIYEMEFWLRKAAFNSYAQAQLELAKAEYDLYSDLINNGEETDYYKLAFIAGECVYWYRQAIARNYAPAVERLDYVNAFEKSLAEFKQRNNLTGKNPYEDLFYSEAPMAYLAGKQNVKDERAGEPGVEKPVKVANKGLIAAIAVVAVLAVTLGIVAALFKDKIAERLSPETTAAQTTTVPAIAPTTVPPVTQAAQEKAGVVDGAALFTAEQKAALQTRIDTIIAKYKFDVVMNTQADIGETDVRGYAAIYYASNGCGIGDNRDGLVFVLNMASYEYYTYTSGYGIMAFTSGGIKDIGSAMSDDLSNGRYFEAFSTYLEYVDRILASYNDGELFEGSAQQGATTAVITAAPSATAGSQTAVVNTQSTPLNVRKEPSASADKVGQFAKGTTVTVEGNVVTDSSGAKWYRCTGKDAQGARISGYCNAEYLKFQ